MNVNEKTFKTHPEVFQKTNHSNEKTGGAIIMVDFNTKLNKNANNQAQIRGGNKMTKQYGLNVAGVIRVFRKDKDIQGKNKKTFTIKDVWFNTSEKNEDGAYFNVSTNLIFKKDLPIPENNTVIEIIEAFPIITGNGNFRKMALYVKDWADEGHPPAPVDKDPFANDGQPIDISDDNLPF